MYNYLKKFYGCNPCNSLITHNETNTDYIVEAIKRATLPVISKRYKDRNEEKLFLSLMYPTDVREIDFFFDSPLNYIEYYKRFKGVFVIDLSGYKDNVKSPNIDKLVEYIKESNKDTIYILLFPKSGASADWLYLKFCDNSLLERIDLPNPTSAELKKHFITKVNDSSILSTEKSKTILKNLSEEEFMILNFTTFSEIDILANKIMSFSSNNGDISAIVKAAHEFAKNRKNYENHTIGF